MHGIRTKSESGRSRVFGQTVVNIRRVSIRYRDGRTLTFIPDQNSEFYAEDDLGKLADIIDKAAKIGEWGENVEDRYAR